MQNAVKTKHLVFAYPDNGFNSLDDINLDISQGEFVAVLGHNGSGKSTLAKHFNAILLPSGGVCYVDGIDTKDESKLLDLRKNTGMVFQNPDNQLVATIVEDDIAFGCENLGIKPDEIRDRVNEAMKICNITEYRKYSPSKLSGGQKQRVAIAGIMAMKPKTIILDEPTAMLDPKGRHEVIDTITKLNKENNITIILITHYMEEAVNASRVIVLNNGKIICDGTAKEVFSQSKLLKEVGLNVPASTLLCDELKNKGIDIPQGVISPEECISLLSDLLNKEGK